MKTLGDSPLGNLLCFFAFIPWLVTSFYYWKAPGMKRKWDIDLVSLFSLIRLIAPDIQVADSLEKGTEHEDEYMISEKELLVNRYVLPLKA